MKKTLIDFKKMKASKTQLTWITAYDYPFAYCAEQAGIDMILVGDSGGMCQLGYATTNPVTMDEMILMAKAVRKGAPETFIVGDMPQGSYEVSEEEAVRNALRFVKEAGCDAIKLEGGIRVIDKVRAITNAGILVIGHLGLTPQSTQTFGGYRVQGKTVESFEDTMQDALALEQAGIFALLLEAMPSESAGQVAKRLTIPVYGIGAGNQMDGQLIIMHDLLGFHPPFRPLFAKCYIKQVMPWFSDYLTSIPDIRKEGRETRKDGLLVLVQRAIHEYCAEVRFKEFPQLEYCYPLKAEDLERLTHSVYWEKTTDGEFGHYPIEHTLNEG
jgi:3-methyl-2-oxobutanoate hydroxymethyltransferase